MTIALGSAMPRGGTMAATLERLTIDLIRALGAGQPEAIERLRSRGER